jgi:hypothetical protein
MKQLQPQCLKTINFHLGVKHHPYTGSVIESGDFATLFSFLVRQHWGGCCYGHFAANFKAF